MAWFIGGNPGAVYTEDDQVKGKCPVAGTYSQMVDSQGVKGFYLCKVAASQNLTNGHVVTIGANFVVTIAAANSGAVNATNMMGVAVVSITASASTLIWVQVLGRGNVQASLSANPGISLKVGSVAGNVDDDVTSSISAHIHGIVLTATSNLSTNLCACLLTHPRLETTGDQA